MVNELKFPVLLFGVSQAIRFAARRHPSFNDLLKKKN